jgi:anti-sigma factor RsiW
VKNKTDYPSASEMDPTQQPPISDEWLSAWLDGELSAAERARVEAWLQANPAERARVEAWAADGEALAAHFQPFSDAPVPTALRQQVLAVPMPRRWALAAAAAGLLVAGALLGGTAAWQWQQQRHADQLARVQQQLAAGTPQGWVQRAAFAHSVYVGEPRHAVEVKAQEEHLARWLTRRIQIPVKLFDLREQGFELVGGRLLPDGPGKSAQLMYQPIGDSGPERRVTVYLRKPEAGADTAFAWRQDGALGMFYWVEEGAGYALVGAQPKETLLALAQAIYQQHPAVNPAAVPATGAASAASAAPAAASR